MGVAALYIWDDMAPRKKKGINKANENIVIYYT